MWGFFGGMLGLYWGYVGVILRFFRGYTGGMYIYIYVYIHTDIWVLLGVYIGII